MSRPAEIVSVAPGRVNLIGEHVDYNDGFVLPAAIERWTAIAAGRRKDHLVRVLSSAMKGSVDIHLDEPLQRSQPQWANYLRGVLAGFQSRGITLPGLDLVIETTVPIGGGLSSSAALEVAMATLLEQVTGHVFNPDDKALLCQRAEHDFAGVPCGIMDQFTAVHGRLDHLLLLDCRSRQIQYVPLLDPSVALLIIDTRVHHNLVEGEYAQRRAACRSAAETLGVASLRDLTEKELQQRKEKLSPEVFRRARHVVTEIARTVEAAEALAAANWSRVADLMCASHASLRDDYQVSCPELDFVAATANLLKGVLGCRMTGGGFGGCAVALVQAQQTEAVMNELAAAYRRHFGHDAALFVTRPVDGALAKCNN
jgi:galactokinase